jgi:soluble lytic murein transglycosylase-like protein
MLVGILGALTAPLFHTRAHAQTLSAAIENWAGPITEASQRFGIPDAWIRAVMQAESAGRTDVNGQPIRSKAGAMGLMQVMPGTWDEMRRHHELGPDPDDPRDNILAGTAYLRAMYDRFGYPGMFAAYNAGPARYLASLSGARLPAETADYLAKLTRFSASTGIKFYVFPTPGPFEVPVQASIDRRLFAIKRDVQPAGKLSP